MAYGPPPMPPSSGLPSGPPPMPPGPPGIIGPPAPVGPTFVQQPGSTYYGYSQQMGPSYGPLASWPQRLGAYLLDGFIVSGFVFIPVWIILLIVGITSGQNATTVSTTSTGAPTIHTGVIMAFVIGYFVAIIIATSIYFAWTMSRTGQHNGQTWGKQAVNIRVVRDNGQPVTIKFALIREVLVKFLLFNLIGAAFFYLLYLLDYLWPLGDRENRALHDKMVHSHVIEVYRAPIMFGQPPALPFTPPGGPPMPMPAPTWRPPPYIG